MRFTSQLLATSAVLATAALAQSTGHGTDDGDLMGPAAFMWPADRDWHENHDNTAPCGSSKGPGARAKFPLVGGTVALTIDDPSETVKIAISYKDDPKSNSDFTTVVPAIARLDEGHQCYRIGEVPRDIEEGDNATIQLQYQAVENGKKQTFYACADIQFVAVSKFTDSPPCFNVTSDEFKTINEVELEKKVDNLPDSSAGRMFAGVAGALAAAVGVASLMM